MDADVARVRAYPFRDDLPLAGRPFALGGGWDGDGPALVAFGANASPVVLAAKLGAHARVSARPRELEGFDACFSAHVSPYGAVPATLVASPGTVLAVFELRVEPAALARLDATEPNYRREPLAGTAAQAYASRHGALRVDGGPVALAAVPARGRRLPALTEAELLERLRERLDPGADPDAFVLAGVRDAAVREARTQALHAGL